MVYPGEQHHEKAVGTLFNQSSESFLMSYWPASHKVLLNKLNEKSFNMNVVQVYASTSNFSEEVGKFYEKVSGAKKQ